MLGDILTVAWKELKEILFQRGSLRTGALGLVMLLVIFGVVLPLQMGRGWLNSPMVLFYWLWVPLFLVSGIVADSFAGERERHTLEALLATRLSDRAILFGKLCAALTYGWGVTLGCLFLGLVTVNLAHGEGEWLFYPPVIALGSVSLSLLSAGVIASGGVVISLWASSVRQAQQTMSIAIMVVLFAPMFGMRALPPQLQRALAEFLQSADVPSIILGTAGFLLALNIVMLYTALARFKRTRLILS